jgi:hypothetical protein
MSAKRCLAGLFPILLCAQPTAFAQDFEAAPVFDTTDLISADQMKGPGFEVAPQAPNNGLQNTYTIQTPDGSFEVQGTDLVKLRAHEMYAVHAFKELEGTDEFAEAASAAATGPLDFAKNMVLSPVETTGAVADGVGSFFENIGHSMFGGASEQEEGVVKTILGFDEIKRGYAKEFGVDPYTTNPILKEELDSVSWTGFAGGLGPRVAFSLIPGGVGLAIQTTSFSDSMSELVYANTPAALKDLNRDKLTAMGVDEETAGLFLEHPQFSPTRKTFIVGALEQMSGVEDRGALIEVALLAETAGDAFLWQKRAEMFTGYHVNVEPAARLVRIMTDVVILTPDGKLIGMVPTDYVAWTEANAALTSRTASEEVVKTEVAGIGEVSSKELWFLGGVSPLAQQNLEANGWASVADARDRLTLQ